MTPGIPIPLREMAFYRVFCLFSYSIARFARKKGGCFSILGFAQNRKTLLIAREASN
jgi:hypothetical protein